jgi:sugar diacid utilization regulator
MEQTDRSTGADPIVSGQVLGRVAADAAADAGGLNSELLGDFLPSLAGAVAAGRRLPRGQVQRCRARGQQAARTGVALPALLDLHLSAVWRLWRELPLARDLAADSDAVVTAGEVVLRAVDDAVAALAGGYQLARRGLIREQESARREFIDDLLAGAADVAGLLERATGFGLDLAGPHAVALVRAEHPFTDGTPLMGVLERAVQDQAGSSGVLVASKDTRLVAIAAAPSPEAVNALVRSLTGVLAAPGQDPGGVDLRRRADVGAWQIGVSRARPGPVGVLASYDEAQNALALAGKLGRDEPVVFAADLLVFQVLLRDRAAITDLVNVVLAPLKQARGGAQPLLDTLDAYFDAGGNAARAARTMHLSVRALTYRLDRVHQLTGHDPTQSTTRFTLHAAVLGAKLLDWPGKLPDK